MPPRGPRDRFVLQLLQPILEGLIIHLRQPVAFHQLALAGALPNQLSVEILVRIATVDGILFSPPLGPTVLFLRLSAGVFNIVALQNFVGSLGKDAPVATRAGRIHVDPVGVFDDVVQAPKVEAHRVIRIVAADRGPAQAVVADGQTIDPIGLNADTALGLCGLRHPSGEQQKDQDPKGSGEVSVLTGG